MTASSGVAAAGLACAIAWTAAGSLGPESPHVASLAADLDAKVRETAASVKARAETLAQLPRLEVAVATDAQTIRDLTADELAFRPHASELIEIAQVPRLGGAAGAEGTPKTMLRIPDGGPPLPMGQSGVSLQIWQGQIHVAAIVSVEPRERSRELRGAVAVDQPLDLSTFSSRVRALGLTARVALGPSEISLGGISHPDGGSMVMELGAGPTQLKLVLQGIPQPSRLHFLGPFALALVSTGAARLLKRRPPVVELVPAPPTGGGAPPRPQPSQQPLLQAIPVEVGSEASNATIPVAAGAAANLLMALPPSGERTAPNDTNVGQPAFQPRDVATQSAAPPGTTIIPSSFFETDAPDAMALPAPPVNEGLDRQYRALFSEFVKLRTACHEPTSNLDADWFVRALRWKREELVNGWGLVEVEFRIAFHNGRAVVRLPALSRNSLS